MHFGSRQHRFVLVLYGSFIGTTSALGQTNVLTYHNDNMRTGQNLSETQLTPQNVRSATFGKLFTLPVDGKVDAQPLLVSGLSIPGRGTHNVVFVATEHGSLYAFDADTGATYWQVSLLRAGETPSDNRGCGQVTPEIGITGTPVIDPAAGPHGTIYAVAMSKDSTGGYHQRLHAIDITTGAEQFNGPVEVQATYPGNGDNSTNGTVVFDAKRYKSRPGLLLANGVVYTSWGSHCDIRPYTGWNIGYNRLTLAQTSVFNFAPNGEGAAIWGAGGGSAADSNGTLFFQIGNGTFDTGLNGAGFPSLGDYGNAFVKLGVAGGPPTVLDYWTMFNTVAESNADQDLGSGGVLLIPDVLDAGGNTRHLGIGVGKDGDIYMFDRDNMGKFNPNNNSNLYQSIVNGVAGPEFASPAWFNGTIYLGAVGDVIRAFRMTAARLGTTPTSTSQTAFPFPGTTPSISANGTSNAILWAVASSNPAVLHAYDPNNLATEFYNSNQAPSNRDQFGSGNKFITPSIANGKVYVGTPNSVAVFGLLGPTLSSVTPGSGMQGSTVNVTLAGTNFLPGSTVGVSGSGVTVSNVVVVSASQITASFTVNAGAPLGNVNVTVSTTASTSGPVPFAVTSPGGFSAIRIDAGSSSSYTDPAGIVWNADANYTGGGPVTTPNPVNGTATPALYQTGHFGPLSGTPLTYQFPAPNGAYTVNLKFDENVFSQPGQRVFNVVINGQTVLANFDIFSRAGSAFQAVDAAVPVSVTGGQISIQFVSIVGNPRVCAIEILGGSPPAPLLSSLSPASGSPGAAIPVTLDGSNFSTDLVVNAGPKIAVSNVTVVSATQLTATFTIAGNAAPGIGNVTVSTAGGTTAQTFSIGSSAPAIASVSPASSAPGNTIPVTLNGSNFAAGASVATTSPGISVGNVNVVSSSQITATFAIAANATPGAFNITVTTSAGASPPAAFTITSSSVFTPIRIDAGSSSAYTDPAGIVWSVDANFTGGGLVSSANPVNGTPTPALYQTAHWGPLSGAPLTYQFSVPNGAYMVNLKFDENVATQSGQRVFNVVINGQTVLANFDIFARAGAAFQAVDAAVPVTVSGGQISIQFVSIAGNPRVCAIEILAGSPPAPSLASISPLAGARGAAVPVTLDGSDFSTSLVVNAGPKIVVSNVVVVSSSQVTATFNIAANASPGITNVTVSTAGGMSTPRTFTVQ